VGLEEMGEKTEEIRKKERGSVLIMCYCYLCRDIMEEGEREACYCHLHHCI